MKKSHRSPKGKKSPPSTSQKMKSLAQHVESEDDGFLSTNQGLPINDDQNSLKAGDRGPSLLEDFILREKITHFDHERIPERIVHARGSGAHGVFQVYDSLEKYTRAGFLQDPEKVTPVFVRFSTVAGSRGSTDLARDVRGFSVKFYTDEGNFDLVGNNMPVFFIQDAMKFPDLIHAVKPEPHNEIPQAASAHDTFWDFISLTPESAHMIMWVMSDRAIPRSYRMMEGFGVHTFRLINTRGTSSFVKFHWKPLLGMSSVLWDEAQRISGCDPDFHRRDLWEAIENGDFPEWELGLQIIPEKDEHRYDFDLLDPTKLVPEELVPVQRVGKLTLNRNPDNFFAEVEQVAFHPGHLVPGIDFTNDPLLQGRLFSYTDTQLIRLGGPNFHEIPINRPVAPLHNHQRDGFMRQMINPGRVAYEPNSLNGNAPLQASAREGGFVSYAERVDGAKLRAKSPSFADHFSQAAMFYHSQAEHEQQHIINALRFELGKCETPQVRERMVYVLSQINGELAEAVASGLGIDVPSKSDGPLNRAVGADAKAGEQQPKKFTGKPVISPALSIANSVTGGIETRKIAALCADGFHDGDLQALQKSLSAAGAALKIIAPRGGTILSDNEKEVAVDFALPTTASVLFDAVCIIGGEDSTTELLKHSRSIEFVEEAFKHCKPIAAVGSGVDFLRQTRVGSFLPESDPNEKSPTNVGGIILGADKTAAKVATEFIKVLGQQRIWEREQQALH